MYTKQKKMNTWTLHHYPSGKSPMSISVACKLVYKVKDPVGG